MQAHVPTSIHTHTHTRTKSHTWHYVCLNNRFLVQCSGLLGVWLEPLGDLSVRAMQAKKFALGSRGTCSGSLNSWLRYALCFTLWTLTPENVWHTCIHSHWWEHKHAYRERRCTFSKSILCAHITDTARSLFQALHHEWVGDSFILKTKDELDKWNCFFKILTKWQWENTDLIIKITISLMFWKHAHTV